ncbi:CDP-alcohol phosphatidyltransferase family protein [Sulfitobacter sp.]|uniref:CDP-alcohol phosphatidyltransferase family protein n=1 Tax=Sulfitobacter sp. TaxID=1903071 RepID=UPI0032975AD6
MRIWIDAAPASQAPRLFGFTSLERILRSVKKAADPSVEVVISGMPDATTDPRYKVAQDNGTVAERLASYLATVEGPVLVLDGGAVIDARLVPLLMEGADPVCFTAAAKDTAVLRLNSDTLPPADATSLQDIANQMLAAGTIRQVTPDELPDFIGTLRRNVPFLLERVQDDTHRAELEKRLFHLNYKGSTDFMTKWVYPPIVWQLTRLCIRWRITPNMVTIFSIFLTILAVPLFAYQYWFAGFVAAYGMTILDSVDGKLARLTLTDSPIGNILDHGLDIVHPPFWYAAWAAGLLAGGSQAPLYTATIWLTIFYIADRLALMVAKARFKRGLHALTTLDGTVRTFIARRNVNLVIFTLGVAIGLGSAAFLFITVWQGLTFAWHAARTFWLYPKARHTQYLT